ncbi:helix-turn-helix transcriptional regulator [Streptomyces mobaraensis NBRC 13819 = DSM 40847]|uniref:Helix-turn-helix transcriptional regulator n=2 Tax=Streptomyces mobaraensis TaxID=35621 RepID=A0A5N5W847_STRMB|nr:helix-turn-helix transcriptional regulator [Streptomyces mobaraensis]EMF02501.1 helix-turn-helix domain-containing protein [Streptomyces mobaraensis NBRC 13819 = DSM 40847]KAB7845469.1 helix-turn-helix transcriptional regulator [Streptomyces mobaraensis]QTT76856.1 helix-turn-helix transcriptional regulator [Streptomyces mobaraensis NBRC 13819 = DSM 40847]
MAVRGDRAAGDTGSPLAGRLNYLFANMHPPGAPYTNAHVAEEISRGTEEYGGVTLTEQYLSMLRNGKRANPSPDVLRALAKFFAVPVGYLMGDLSAPQTARVEEEVRFLVAMRDQRVRAIALRSVGLPPEVQDSLTTIISQFRQQMNLPSDPPGAGGEERP